MVCCLAGSSWTDRFIARRDPPPSSSSTRACHRSLVLAGMGACCCSCCSCCGPLAMRGRCCRQGAPGALRRGPEPMTLLLLLLALLVPTVLVLLAGLLPRGQLQEVARPSFVAFSALAGQKPGLGCMARRCGTGLLACGLLSPFGCLRSLLCFARCGDDTSCDFRCEMEARDDVRLGSFMQCCADHGCLRSYPPDCFPAAECRHGNCNATDDETEASLIDLEQIQGEWWTVNGLNPHYDYYFCQHQRIGRDRGGWVNNVTYGITSHRQQLSNSLQLSMSKPGVLVMTYQETLLKPQVETWRVVSWPHADWMFVLWCGENPVIHYSGGFLLSRHRSIHSLPEGVRRGIDADLKPLGMQLLDLQAQDNEACPASAGTAEDGSP
ncbi:unnamed protein product [Polarella glacialis]|uniref:VDE lipocalin domain-containing protein n=1 Tax=Polarella glacialis TaxID=89957 RepID=A0A813HXZ1_POLGL|nr:unnamed protein product [Polarella glacialis]